MRTFTTQQRAEIYLEAAKETFECDLGCCWGIRLVAVPDKDKFLTMEWMESNFPEFFLFQPDERRTWWWEDEEEIVNTDCRILALLFAREMCLQK